eukprot:NODE_15184_length_227_cov_15.848837.p2 GENE.NODE_15184_length_227_cov_15.848837~~NODE_15184_length_227_cov_15.848837.p2  ORF type:complete len:57 (-),score=24.61 NODE_15184_length_227_cov_15.848837:39-209(-)
MELHPLTHPGGRCHVSLAPDLLAAPVEWCDATRVLQSSPSLSKKKKKKKKKHTFYL